MQDSEAFRLAFRRLAAGVSVITALDPDGVPVGFTATSLASLAAVPPMATFNMARTASAWRAVEQTETHLENLEAAEVGTIDELRWWAPDALASSGEVVHDPLLSMMRVAIERVVP